MWNEGMLNPFNCVTLALSYIKGINVDDWVAQQIDEVYWKVYGIVLQQLYELEPARAKPA